MLYYYYLNSILVSICSGMLNVKEDSDHVSVVNFKPPVYLFIVTSIYFLREINKQKPIEYYAIRLAVKKDGNVVIYST